MIALRPATGSDLPTLWELRTRAIAQACAAHYAPELLAVWLATPAPASLRTLIEAGGGLVAVEDSQTLGYAVLDAAKGEVDAVFVEPGWHGRGIGKLLLGHLEASARAAGKDVLFLSASLNAVAFYRRAGFVAVREERYPHRSGLAIPSVYMEKVLAP